MANLKQFQVTPEQSGFTPSEGGPSALARTGMEEERTSERAGQYLAKGAAAVGNVVEKYGRQVQQQQETKEILRTSQAYADLAVKSTEDVQKLMATSDDPAQAVKDYYTQTYQPAAEKINADVSTPGGQRFAAQHGASHAEAFMTRNMAEAHDIQGARNVAEFHGTMDSLAAAAHASPEMAKDYADHMEQTFDAIKASLPANQQVAFERERPAMREQLLSAGAHGAISSSDKPEQAADNYISAHAKDLSPARQEELRHFARAQQHENDFKVRQASQDAASEWTDKMIDPNTGDWKKIDIATMQAINQDPRLRPQDRGPLENRLARAYQEQLAIQNNLESAKSDPHTLSQLYQRVGDPNTPTTQEQIDDAAARGLISPKAEAGLRMYLQQLNGADPKSRQLKEYNKDADETIKAMTKTQTIFGAAPPSADDKQAYVQAKMHLQDYYASIKAAHPEATDRDIFHEGGKYYWYDDPSFQKYHRGNQSLAGGLASATTSFNTPEQAAGASADRTSILKPPTDDELRSLLKK